MHVQVRYLRWWLTEVRSARRRGNRVRLNRGRRRNSIGL